MINNTFNKLGLKVMLPLIAADCPDCLEEKQRLWSERLLKMASWRISAKGGRVQTRLQRKAEVMPETCQKQRRDRTESEI